jgi:hypothetical protein
MTMIVDYNKPAPWALFVASDIVITGQDFEMADYDNPRGYTYGEAFFVRAEDVKGYRRVLMQTFDTQNDADMFAAGLDGWSPEAEDWGYDTPCYGSTAYIESDAESDLIAFERDMEGTY